MWVVLVLIFNCFNTAQAQEKPPIQVFSPKTYNAENQNWDITQDENNYMYFANNGGLLEYNGSEWTLYEVPDSPLVRTVLAYTDKIYTGSFMDFGYWERNVFGTLEYTSLIGSMGISPLDDEQFWNIEAIDKWLLFQSLSRIYLIDLEENEFKIIEPGGQILKLIKVDNSVFFHVQNKGLYTINNGEFVLVSDHNIFRDRVVTNIFQINNDYHYLLDDGSMYRFDGTDYLNVPFASPSPDTDLRIFSSDTLLDGSIVLGTISQGILILNEKGDIQLRLDRTSGMGNNTVLSLYEDSQNNIWLGLDNGINCVNMGSRFRFFTDDEGKLGTVYTSIIHEDHLYLGTNQGLFYKPMYVDEEFEFISGTNGQVWMLKEIDGQLFCGHNNGTYIITGGEIGQAILEASGSWDFRQNTDYPNLILQGNYNGLHVLAKKEGKWMYRNKIIGFDISTRFFEWKGTTVYVSHEFSGLYRLELSNDLMRIYKNDQIKSVGYQIGTSLLSFGNKIYYTTTEGIYRDLQGREFSLDTTFTALFKDMENLTTLMPVTGGRDLVWRYADNTIIFLEPGKLSEDPLMDVIPLSSNLRNVVDGFGNISQIKDDIFLLGTSNGYILLDQKIEPFKNIPEVRINSAQSYALDEASHGMNLDESPVLSNEKNNLSFRFSMPAFHSTIQKEYRVQLEGLNESWTNWSTTSERRYENLPYGDYTFKVRGRIGNKVAENIAEYKFRIERPFLLSNAMIGLYLLGLILTLFTVHILYRRHYRRQQGKLIEQSLKEFEIKELESTQELMRLKNEKLQQNIEGKNRELAISTMSLIKKNEFLNSIKKELKTADNSVSRNRVIKIIDNNINNTDDWKLFEEAFNNADKDFLKKIKNEHPDLTSNDLRLCAYLRLNLSSKEIAPLLNISTRSVEVKRYRLRKKMNLPHETNLTNYILEL
ncbi:MAG: hypothetical protein HKO94_13945 [Flavobacteriaceae bacterium]|nr:hypothetical protein [Flavobacteriaceae bacterium]